MKLKAVVLSLSAVISSSLLSGCSMLTIGEEEFSCPGREKGVLCAGPRDVYEMTNTQDEILMGGVNEDGVYVHPDDNSDKSSSHNDAWLIKNFDRLEAEAMDDPDDDTIGLYRKAVRAKMKNMSNPNRDSMTEQTVYEPRSHNRQHPNNYDQAEVISNFTVNDGIVTKQGELGELSLFNTAPHDIAPEPLALLKPAEVMRVLIVAYKDNNNDLHMPGYVYVDLQPRSWIIGEQANSTPQRIIPLDIRNKTQRQIVEEKRRGQGVTGLGVGQLPQMPNGQNAFSADKAEGKN